MLYRRYNSANTFQDKNAASPNQPCGSGGNQTPQNSPNHTHWRSSESANSAPQGSRQANSHRSSNPQSHINDNDFDGANRQTGRDENIFDSANRQPRSDKSNLGGTNRQSGRDDGNSCGDNGNFGNSNQGKSSFSQPNQSHSQIYGQTPKSNAVPQCETAHQNTNQNRESPPLTNRSNIHFDEARRNNGTSHQNCGDFKNDRHKRNQTPQNEKSGNINRTENGRAPQNERSNNGQRAEGGGKKSFDIGKMIEGLVPSALYNPQTKKFLGLIGAEDLLLLALIFLIMENDKEKDPALILALVYILASEYIDLPDLSF